MIDRQLKLNWPADEPRTPQEDRRKSSPFTMNFDRALRLLEQELDRFKAVDVVLCHNTGRTGVPTVKDAAAVIYFKIGGRSISIPCDLYFSVQDNIRAIGEVVKAMRRMEMYGGTRMSQKSFTGFVALPPPLDCWKVLKISKGVGEGLSNKLRREFVMEAFRDRAKEGYSDMAQLVEMRDQALRELGVQGES